MLAVLVFELLAELEPWGLGVVGDSDMSCINFVAKLVYVPRCIRLLGYV